MADQINAWYNAEQRCFKHLVKAVKGMDGRNSFLGKLPVGVVNCWAFFTGGGGGEAKVTPAARPCACWRINARIEGLFVEREAAQRVAGLIRNSLPADSTTDGLTGIQLLRWTDEADIDDDVVEVRGSNVAVWRLTIPMELVFNNTAT